MTSIPSTNPHPSLSCRGTSLLAPANQIATAISSAFKSPYSEDNSDGLISLGVAESWLMEEWLTQYFNSHFELVPKDLHYQSVFGPNPFKLALQDLLNKYFHPAIPVKIEHLVTGVGVTAVLEQLLYSLCDANDQVLLAKPYYSGFDRIAKQKLGIVLVGVDVPEGIDPSSETVLGSFELSYQALKSSGLQDKVKCVLLCNPSNPLGLCYSKKTLIEYLKFCERYDLQLIVDEIYAFSVFNPSSSLSPDETVKNQPPVGTAQEFVSALSINCREEAGCNPQRLHVLYGMSKDFGACGLRAGLLISQNNKEVINSVQSTANLMQIPRSTEIILEKLLGNPERLDWYLKENKTKLQEAYEYSTKRLRALKIPYLHSYAGHFVVVDLRSWLPKNTSGDEVSKSPIELEEALFLTLLNDFGLYLSPLMILYHHPLPGFFRLTITTSRDYLEIGLCRLENFLKTASED
ncbi:pyridoxal phosphate-dependent transferase [Melampsora americana]|nr:pyridoxal phosphate-dependent transferase [Melampsora americana]